MTQSAAGIEFPKNPDSITPEWLNQVLLRKGLIHSARVRSCEVVRIGEAGFIGELSRIQVSYSPLEEAAPKTLIAKFSNRDPGQRAVFHGIGFYEREFRFYQDLAARTPVPTPNCYHAEIDLESGRSILLLEDLADSVTVDVSKGCSLEQLELVVRQLADFHAHWWQSEELEAASYVPSIDRLIRIYHFMFQKNWPNLRDRLEALDPMLKRSTALRDLGDRLCRSSSDVFAPLARSPRTLVHMDIHLDNLVFQSTKPDRPLVVFDWQTFGFGRGVTDLTYFMLSSVPIEIRQESEETLLKNYHQRLSKNGVADYTFNECKADYRRAAIWNLLILTAVATAEESDPAHQIYVQAVLPRISAFIEDHSMAEFLEA